MDRAGCQCLVLKLLKLREKETDLGRDQPRPLLLDRLRAPLVALHGVSSVDHLGERWSRRFEKDDESAISNGANRGRRGRTGTRLLVKLARPRNDVCRDNENPVEQLGVQERGLAR